MNILQFANESKTLLKTNKILRFYRMLNSPWSMVTIAPLLALGVYLILGYPNPTILQNDPPESILYGTFVWQMIKITSSMVLGMLPMFIARYILDFFGEKHWRAIKPTISLHLWTVAASNDDKQKVVETLMLLKGPQWKTATEHLQLLLKDSVLPKGWWQEVNLYLKTELSKEKRNHHFREIGSEEEKFEHNRNSLEERVQNIQLTSFKI